MSRTDKDAPSWVRAKYAPRNTEWHHRCENSVWAARAPQGTVFEPCTIDQSGGWCRYFVDSRDFWWSDSPTGEDKNFYWYAPERASVRVSLDAARRDFNAHGETDIEPENRQTRGAPWGGGWWD